MFIHTWIFVILILLILAIAFLSLALTIREGALLDEERERNGSLTEQNKWLSIENARLKAKENIRVANEYSGEC